MKTLLVILFLFSVSMIATYAAILMGYGPLGVLLTNMGVGAALGLVTGLNDE